MQLYGTIILSEFSKANPACRAHVAAWQREVEEAEWAGPKQLKERFVTAQLSKGGGVVFRLLRGLYMLGTKVRFDRGVVVVERAWTNGQGEGETVHTGKKT